MTHGNLCHVLNKRGWSVIDWCTRSSITLKEPWSNSKQRLCPNPWHRLRREACPVGEDDDNTYNTRVRNGKMVASSPNRREECVCPWRTLQPHGFKSKTNPNEICWLKKPFVRLETSFKSMTFEDYAISSSTRFLNIKIWQLSLCSEQLE